MQQVSFLGPRWIEESASERKILTEAHQISNGKAIFKVLNLLMQANLARGVFNDPADTQQCRAEAQRELDSLTVMGSDVPEQVVRLLEEYLQRKFMDLKGVKRYLWGMSGLPAYYIHLASLSLILITGLVAVFIPVKVSMSLLVVSTVGGVIGHLINRKVIAASQRGEHELRDALRARIEQLGFR